MKEELLGKDLRSISKANNVVKIVKTQEQFDELFSFLYEGNRLLTMRSIDVIEKVTRTFPQFLATHKEQLLKFSQTTIDIEFKWHLALLLSRLKLSINEQDEVFNLLTSWVLNKSESKIVRVNALQTLYDITVINSTYKDEFLKVIHEVKGEQVSSLNARINKLNIS